MRILIVHNHYQNFGGEDVVLEQESNLLKQQPNTLVDTLIFHNQKGLKGLLQFAASPWNTPASRLLKEKINHFRPDIIHIHNIHYACGPLVIRTAKQCKLPVVMSFHNFRLLCPSATLFHDGRVFTNSITKKFPWKAIFSRVLDNSLLKTFWVALTYWLHRKLGTWTMVDRYFVLSQYTKHVFINSSLGLADEKYIVKPNFIESIEPNIPDEEELCTDIFLYVGRLSSEKGILALAEILKTSKYGLEIAGSGPQEFSLRAIANEHPNIKLLGQLTKKEVRIKIKQSKGLIIPSLCIEGGVPLSAIEGFLMKTIVIANDIGPLSEHITCGKNGFKINMKDAKTVIKTLNHVFDLDIAQRKEIIEKAYEFAEKQYNKNRILDILTETYQGLIDAEVTNKS